MATCLLYYQWSRIRKLLIDFNNMVKLKGCGCCISECSEAWFFWNKVVGTEILGNLCLTSVILSNQSQKSAGSLPGCLSVTAVNWVIQLPFYGNVALNTSPFQFYRKPAPPVIDKLEAMDFMEHKGYQGDSIHQGRFLFLRIREENDVQIGPD
ncbi:hypothetical protein L6164_015957 [Bauhinia variegata]|uniref:Uncharacterized protein n=1 Tax=Bauhinia variegata TaxID=167791 RepID=A0ACB9NM85_BAUVA|nr:hypothetical protein L6164_015957 [Bauhinia variegata]